MIVLIKSGRPRTRISVEPKDIVDSAVVIVGPAHVVTVTVGTVTVIEGPSGDTMGATVATGDGVATATGAAGEGIEAGVKLRLCVEVECEEGE